ncbi:MAG: PfkB family carbohydrate kinase, partial [Oscillospiraceae bacterium]
MAKYDAIISGYVSMDRVVRINTPAKVGFTSIVNNSDNAKIYYGGCSTNIAYLLAKLNKKSLPVIRLGGNDTEEIGFLKYIKEANVSTDAVTIIDNESTSNCYMIADEDKNHITIFYPGAMDGKYSKPLDKELFFSSSLAVLTIGSYQDNVEFFNKCKQTKTPLVFGMKSDFEGFPVPLLKEILLYSEIIFTNEVEREEIERVLELSSITELFDKGNAKVIITTLGKDGSKFYEKTKNGIASGKVEAVVVNPPLDTTGCGD